MITYNDIYEAARKERYSESLQGIPKNFIDDVASYLRDKREIASKEQNDFSDVIIKTKKQLENAITLFKELMVRRRKKILNLVLIAAETGISKQDFENMFTFEKELFEELMKCVEFSDKKLDAKLNGVKIEEKKNELILFMEDVEEFLGLEGEKMGPFFKGQIANIPKEIAKILIDSGKAEIVEDN
ncbi:DNA replication complex GINS family protein [Candidatus Pacearchaeota archaeon]|nr:DNA replication complex GINS family protein [Candidatus Pacearchaeota archaeon]